MKSFISCTWVLHNNSVINQSINESNSFKKHQTNQPCNHKYFKINWKVIKAFFSDRKIKALCVKPKKKMDELIECMNGKTDNNWKDEWMKKWKNEHRNGLMRAWIIDKMNEWMKWWMDEWMNEWMNECTWTPGRVYPLLELLSSVPSSPLIFLFLLLFSQSSPKHKNLQVNHIPIPIPSTRLETRLNSTQSYMNVPEYGLA